MNDKKRQSILELQAKNNQASNKQLSTQAYSLTSIFSNRAMKLHYPFSFSSLLLILSLPIFLSVLILSIITGTDITAIFVVLSGLATAICLIMFFVIIVNYLDEKSKFLSRIRKIYGKIYSKIYMVRASDKYQYLKLRSHKEVIKTSKYAYFHIVGVNDKGNAEILETIIHCRHYVNAGRIKIVFPSSLCSINVVSAQLEVYFNGESITNADSRIGELYIGKGIVMLARVQYAEMVIIDKDNPVFLSKKGLVLNKDKVIAVLSTFEGKSNLIDLATDYDDNAFYDETSKKKFLQFYKGDLNIYDKYYAFSCNKDANKSKGIIEFCIINGISFYTGNSSDVEKGCFAVFNEGYVSQEKAYTVYGSRKMIDYSESHNWAFLIEDIKLYTSETLPKTIQEMFDRDKSYGYNMGKPPYHITKVRDDLILSGQEWKTQAQINAHEAEMQWKLSKEKLIQSIQYDSSDTYKKQYSNHCWNCHTVIDSKIDKQCTCGFYLCNKCGKCLCDFDSSLKKQAPVTSNSNYRKKSYNSTYRGNTWYEGDAYQAAKEMFPKQYGKRRRGK